MSDDCLSDPAAQIRVTEAQARLRAALAPTADVERLPAHLACGRVLAGDAVASRAHPPADNSAVDGYALGAGLLNAEAAPLAEGRAAAGAPYGAALPEGCALRILTGAQTPEGTAAVVMEEDIRREGDRLHLPGAVKPGANIRPAGEDVAAGAVALSKGRRLAPQDLALLAALDVREVSVHRRLRVAALSTGDELCGDASAPLAEGRLRDANRPMLLALLARWGFETLDLGCAPDDAAEIAARLDAGAAQADAILTSGGASAGDEDHVSRLLRAHGELTSWRVRMKPGRPLALAQWRGAAVFGLPGNPVAAFVCALIFARPALGLMAGEGWRAPMRLSVPAAFSRRKKPGRTEYLRARLDAAGRAEAFISEGSGRISGLSWADGLVELPEAAAEIAPGDPVSFLPFGQFGA